MQQIGVRLLLEQFTRQMQAAADAGRGIRQGSRSRLGLHNQLAHAAHLGLRTGDQHVGRLGQHGDGHKVALDVEREIGHQCRVDGQVACGNHQQRLAVGPGAFNFVDAEVARSTGQVLNHHREPGFLLQTFGQDARQHINRTSWRKRRNDGHAFLRSDRQGSGQSH